MNKSIPIRRTVRCTTQKYRTFLENRRKKRESSYMCLRVRLFGEYFFPLYLMEISMIYIWTHSKFLRTLSHIRVAFVVSTACSFPRWRKFHQQESDENLEKNFLEHIGTYILILQVAKDGFESTKVASVSIVRKSSYVRAFINMITPLSFVYWWRGRNKYLLDSVGTIYMRSRCYNNVKRKSSFSAVI